MTASKIVAAAASSQGSSALDVDDVFSSFVYSGTSADQTITNNIDLSGEGGLVWLKSRTTSHNHYLFDTVRGFNSGAAKFLSTNNTNANADTSNFGVSSFNSDGFSLHDGWSGANQSGADFISWTFRKAEKFFDIVTYTGNATNRTIAHNLGSAPGMIIIKDLSGTGAWTVFHRKTDDTFPGAATWSLNLGAETKRGGDATVFQDTLPTSTVFSIGTDGSVNESGRNFIAYLFAHNDGDGTFGPDEDQDIIKCGHYSGDNDDLAINLGFEPQFILVKNVTMDNTDWRMFDTMRFWQNPSAAGDSVSIRPNQANAESGIARFFPTSTGFGFNDENGASMNSTGSRYIYMAIRKGSLSPPEAASEVFNVASATGASGALGKFRTTFRVDLALDRDTRDGGGYFRSSSRLTGTKRLTPTSNDSETNQSVYEYDYMKGFHSEGSSDSNHFAWMWQRAPKFCDVVCWKGSGSNRTLSHNLGVAPEMMWVKIRNGSYNWQVYHSALGNTKYLELNTTVVASTHPNRWNDTTPTSSVFSLGNGDEVNRSGEYFYVAYLFTTLAGISKVGSFTATGSTINVDCGFTNGAKFILMKRSDSTTAGWLVWDSVRGIVAGNDPYLLINNTDGEVTNTDYVDPLSSGFTVSDNFYSAGTWIFYAIAA